MASLLRAHAESRDFFAARPGIPAPGDAVPATDPNVGLRIGPYRTIRLIAEGGMASVYLAERIDAAYRKQTAVKILRPGLGTRDFLERFRTERQVLADLEHPNIARLVDGGTTDAGLPYLVMEFVDGEPVDVHADRLGLDVDDRLRLFLRICDAVDYAHRNLVVHRDLKPSNILVDAQGEPKLLDFGIAKVLDPALPQSLELTRTANRALTPRYASPEQVRGDRVTTATDVYSLGVLLYELLTGLSPYRLQEGALFDIERAIASESPSRPSLRLRETAARGHAAGIAASRGTTPRRLEQKLAGDLDTIVLRALGKDPERRYPGVPELAADLRRHLDGLPVLARPDTVRYRLSRFASRNRALVAGVAGVIAVLAIALSFALAANHRARVAAEASAWLAYTNALAAAEYAILNGEKTEAATRLESVPPGRRGWEWRHLHRRLDRSLKRWPGHRGGITGVAWLPGGAGFLSCSLDSTVALWSPDADVPRGTWRFPVGVEAVVVNHAGNRAAVGTADGSVLLLAPEPGSEPELLGHGVQWPCPAFSPDDRRLAVGFFDGSVRVWDLVARGEPGVIPDAHPRLALAAFTASGDTLVTAGVDGMVRLWNPATLAPLRGFRAHAQRVYAMDLSRDGRIATGSIDRTARVHRLDTGELLADFREHEGTVSDLAFDPGGRSVISLGPDGRILAWNAATAAVEGALRGQDSDGSVVAVSPDGSRILTGEWAGALRLWDRRTQDVRTLFAHRLWMVNRLTEARFDPTGARVALAGVGDAGVIWHLDPDTTHAVWRLVVSRVAWLPGSGDLLFPLGDGGLGAVDADADALAEFPEYSVATLALAVSPRGDRCATAGADSMIALWNLPGRDRAAAVRLGQGVPVCLAFSPDGSRLAAGDEAGSVRVFDAATADSVVAWAAHDGAVTALAYLPDGRLASVSVDGSLRLWDAARGTRLGEPMTGQAPLTALAVHPRGECVVTAGADQVLHFLDLASGRRVVTFHGHVARVAWLEFSPDGSLLASAGFDGAVRIWDAPLP